MDPCDIINISLPLRPLCTFVATSFGWNFVIAYLFQLLLKDSNCTRALLMLGPATIIFHGLIVLCGIHPTDCPLHTFILAFYLASNMILPAILSEFEILPRHAIDELSYRSVVAR
jgi:hypothetical protein